MTVLSFGEILLRLAAPGYTKLFQKDSLDISFCGGEANVAVSLANFGICSQFMTKLPMNSVGEAAVNTLRYFGVDVSKIIYSEGRMGIYYLEKGASQRPSKVIYDRSYSTISMAENSNFDWDTIFQGVDWFHWTGINPALSDELAQISLEACKVAKNKGITISCDLNYRGQLWSSEKAKLVMTKLMPYVDICIANEEDADKVLGIRSEESNVSMGKLDKHDYISVATNICNTYGCKYVAITLRESFSASKNGWSAMLFNAEKNESYFSKEYNIQLVDRVGGGDSFTAGIIYGLINEFELQDIVEFAVAASCLKQCMEGDFNRSSVSEVRNLMKNGGSGRIVR